jgi:hypothetical protein
LRRKSTLTALTEESLGSAAAVRAVNDGAAGRAKKKTFGQTLIFRLDAEETPMRQD